MNQKQHLDDLLEKYQSLVLLVLTLIYAESVALRAWNRPFWYDEIITLITARMPDWSSTLRAAAACDASPPLPHLLIHFCIRWFGENEITARIPSMLGIWIFSLCLYFIIRKRAGILYGLSALLLPLATDIGNYAAEARGYGLELGFCGLALLAWMRAAEGVRRIPMLALLAVSLTGAFYCHYYAVLMYVPLACGELWRTVHKRRIDFGIWGALAAGALAVLISISNIRSAMHVFQHTWAVPTAEKILTFWEMEGNHFLSVFAIVLFLGALAKAFWPAHSSDDKPRHTIFADYEWLACAVLMAVPTVGGVAASLITHSFTNRYALFGLAGFCLLVPALIASLSMGRSLPAYVLILSLLVPFSIALMTSPGPHDRGKDPYEAEPLIHAALERGPVVVPDGQLFLLLWYYAPQRLKPNLWFPAAPAAAVKYIGFDTIDEGLLVLRPWTRISVMENRDFHPPGGEYTVYQNIYRPGWVEARALDEGAAVEVKGVTHSRELLVIRPSTAGS